jgi:hypothetical protein
MQPDHTGNNGTLSGTWRLMGGIYSSGHASLFLRIS